MAFMKLAGTPMCSKIAHMKLWLRLGNAAEKSKRKRAPSGCDLKLRCMALSMSMMLEEIYLLWRKPLCSGRQNLLAKGTMMVFSREAIMRLSVFTTEMGRRLAGV